MKHLRGWLSIAILLTLPLALCAQPRRDAIVIFKDGFYIKGIVNENIKEVVWDGGRPFPILSGKFFLDDYVRNIQFSPSQVAKVIQPDDFKAPKAFKRYKTLPRQDRDVRDYMIFTSLGKWNELGERDFTVDTKQGKPFTMKQRIATVTPQHIFGITLDYRWDIMYFTDEFGPELTRKIVLQIMSERKKDLKDLSAAQKFLQVAAFMHEAGWFKEAERELAAIIENFPAEKAKAEEMLKKVKKDRAELFIEDLDKFATQVGQHQVALGGVAYAEREEYAKIVSPRHQRIVQDLRAKYDKLKDDMAEMQAFLKSMPARTKKPKDWEKATEFILNELNHDTAKRLEEFLTSSRQYELERKNQAKFSLSAEKVLATAVSGWLQGDLAALPDEADALKMVKARAFLLDYLKTEGSIKRAALAASFQREIDLPIDVTSRLIAMLPPPNAHEKLGTDVQTMTIEVPESNGGSYLVQLPPDYHHQRAYPVLVVLHSGRDKQDETLKRFSDEAAKNGFILAAPQWAGKNPFKVKQAQGKKEHDLVLDTIRDLRWRFQIDSDRVFLFGWEDGANLAFDVGLSHPDQFAGIVPMNGTLLPFTRRFYWPNAQYLPFYVINGERDGYAKDMREHIDKCWIRNPYNCIYVEYKGRASEWYSLEIPKMLSWMKGKRRFMPVKEMGARGNGGGLGEEFHSSRSSDNQFYWLRSEGLTGRFEKDHLDKNFGQFRPATFQATLSVGNKLKKGEADIWNLIQVNVSGTKQVSVMITPKMMDLKNPLAINVNGRQVGAMRKIQPSMETLLEELFQSGDRQRLFVAKVDIRP